MPMNLKHPLVVQFNAENQDSVSQNDDILSASVINSSTNHHAWADFKNATTAAVKSGRYDSVIMSFKPIGQQELANPDILKSANIHARSLLSTAYDAKLPVFNRFQRQLYYLNPSYDLSRSEGQPFVVPDQTVLDKRDRYPDDFDWQKHQADINKKFAVMMPLTTGQSYEHSNHKKDLMDPKRGLSAKQLKDFFSWRSGMNVIPELMNDNMIGIPAMRATAFDSVNVSFHGRPVASTVLNIKTSGVEGYVIPMRNTHGDAAKSQIGSDISTFNLTLKARAKDGTSVQTSEYFNKKTREYQFKLADGRPSQLQVEEADNDHILLVDRQGQFPIDLKKDIKPLLVERGYQIPPIIDNIKPQPTAKYIWPSRGDLVGSAKINNTKHAETNRITPSLAGFITAKRPTNGRDDYIVVVTEGALKGTIAADYMNVKDSAGQSMGERIAGNRGVIVAQVPGVAKAFVASVDRVYQDHKVAGTLIAMDADGRENRAVANGIHSAYDELAKHGPVKVMSWNPAHKGLDDSMLAAARGELTYHYMGIHYGTPDELFPIEQAKTPIPYKINGEKAFKESEHRDPQWMQDYEEHKHTRDANTEKLQEASAAVAVNLNLDGLTPPPDNNLNK